MKIAISSEGNSLSSMVDQRFGRCRYFLVAEVENKEIKEVKSFENSGAAQGHGAGISAAQQVGNLDVEAVITGNLGPNASDVLSEAGIKAYHGSGTAEDALKKFINGELEEITETGDPHPELKTAVKESAERIFFPLLNNKGMDSEISEHFGHAPFFGLYDARSKKLEITENRLIHTDPDKSPVDQIIEAVNPTAVFALGIGGRAIRLFSEKGITLKTGNYKTVGNAVSNIKKMETQADSCGH